MFRPAASLAEIVVYLNIHIGHQGIGTRFRVRNVDTLEDYGITGVAEFGSNGQPSWFNALRLDSFCTETKLRGDFDRYALLSSIDEVKYMSSIGQYLHASLLASSYRESVLAACEVQFGEG